MLSLLCSATITAAAAATGTIIITTTTTSHHRRCRPPPCLHPPPPPHPSQEHDVLLHSLLTPITSYVMELLPEDARETTRCGVGGLPADELLGEREWGGAA